MIVGVGALFAMSLDTISQAGAIGLAARAFGGEGTALAAAAWFGIGMTAVGGANGLWIVGLLRSPSARARTASRLMTGAIGLVNLVIGLLALAGIFAPAVVRWREQSGMCVTGTVIATFCLTFLSALWLCRSRGDGIGNAAAPLSRAG